MRRMFCGGLLGGEDSFRVWLCVGRVRLSVVVFVERGLLFVAGV